MKRSSILLVALVTACSAPSNAVVPLQPAALSAPSLARGELSFEAASTGFTRTSSGAFVFPKCAAVETLDVRGNAGPTLAALRSDDPQIRVERTSVPNRYNLVPQGIPDGNSVAHLTATMGSRAASVDVTIDGTICGKFTEYPLPAGSPAPQTIAAGPDGAMWFTEFLGNEIGRVTTAGKFSGRPVPTKGSHPFFIAAGPDGALWFTENAASKIGRITTTFHITEFPIPAGAYPNGIAEGADKTSMWWVEGAGGHVGRIATASHQISRYQIPTGDPGAYTIAPGPGGEMYYTELYANKIGWVNDAGSIHDQLAPQTNPGPLGIVVEGSTLWYTENCAGAIGQWGKVASNSYPTKTKSSNPNLIVLGPDGALWFTEGNVGKIGRITTAATPVVSEYTIPTAGSGPFGIATGPDGAIWFVESYKNKIGRLQ